MNTKFHCKYAGCKVALDSAVAVYNHQKKVHGGPYKQSTEYRGLFPGRVRPLVTIERELAADFTVVAIPKPEKLGTFFYRVVAKALSLKHQAVQFTSTKGYSTTYNGLRYHARRLGGARGTGKHFQLKHTGNTWTIWFQ